MACSSLVIGISAELNSPSVRELSPTISHSSALPLPKILSAPIYKSGDGNTVIKCLGNKSFASLYSTSGSIKILANGVAVIPKYDACLKQFKILRIALLIAVGSFSSELVFTDALSASSSISKRGYSISLSWKVLVNHDNKLFKTLLFFLTTKSAAPFKLSRLNLNAFNVFLLKSVALEVKHAIGLSAFLSLPTILPTPTGTFFNILSAFLSRINLLSLPTNSASSLSCV